MSTDIPAASLNGVDLDRIRSDYPNCVSEIVRLGDLMKRGTDTDEDFLKLCHLLLSVGEYDKAKELMLANCNEGDRTHQLFMKSFPEHEGFYNSAISAFENQFHCKLSKISCDGPFTCTFSIQPTPDGRGRNDVLLDKESNVYIHTETANTIIGDLIPLSTPENSVPIYFEKGIWHFRSRKEDGSWDFD